MPRYSIPLTAGKTERVPYPGKMFQLVDPGVAGTIDLSVEWGAQTSVERLGAIEQYFRIFSANDQFTGLELTSAVDTTIDILVSQHDMSVNRSDGSTVTISGTSNVAVTGTAATLEKQAAAVTDNPGVAVAGATVPVLAASAARFIARFANIGADPVALGGAGLTWAKRTIMLNPGDVYIEERAAALAWYAVCENGARSASVSVQEVT